MKLICITLISIVCSTWANEDLLMDFVTDALYGDQVERRAVVNALGKAAVKDAARVWAGNMGWSKSLNSGVSKAFEDACLGSSIKPVLNQPFPWNNVNKIIKRAAERLANRDIVFVLDSSGSISSDQFTKAKKAINVLIESFCPTKFGNGVTNAGSKQISVVTFDSTVKTEVDFSESSKGLGYLQDKVLSIKHRKGSTATGSALTHVKNNVLGKGSSRLRNSKVSTDVIVITDGRCNVNCRVLRSEADALRKMGHGVNLFAMGVGNARACELEIISGTGSSLAFGMGDFGNFERFATVVKDLAQSNENKCA